MTTKVIMRNKTEMNKPNAHIHGDPDEMGGISPPGTWALFTYNFTYNFSF